MKKQFCPINMVATGLNIVRLRDERGLSVKDLQEFFGFDGPQAIYKWQWGKSLPTLDNLFGLSTLFGVPVEKIVVLSDPISFGPKKDVPADENMPMAA